jgi:signal transduction histidine kinase
VNAAAVTSLCSAVLQLCMGLVLLGVSRAPGWKSSRVYATISLSAALYSATNVAFALPGASDSLLAVASRLNYLTAAVHCGAWLVNAFGDPANPLRGLSRQVKLLVVTTVGVGLTCFVTGWHAQPNTWFAMNIPWAGVQYRSLETTLFGDLAGFLYISVLGVVFAQFVSRARHEISGSIPQIVGFSIFFLCAVDEVLVTNGVIQFLYLADIGFLAAVVPLATATLRRFVCEAERTAQLSDRLAGEVQERTQERDRTQVALFESERHAALGRLAAGVGHEINNPLAYLRLNIELIGEWTAGHEKSDDLRESIESALDGADRIRRVVDALRMHASASSGERRALTLESFVQSALRVTEHQLRPVARVETRFGPSPTIVGDEAKLVQVLINLLVNAAQALSDEARKDGEITISTGTLADGTATIDIEDNGPGISAGDLSRLAEPYFTTRGHRGGTGLGLYLARGIAQHHGGRLEFQSTVGRGTRARLVLPAESAWVEDEPELEEL